MSIRKFSSSSAEALTKLHAEDCLAEDGIKMLRIKWNTKEYFLRLSPPKLYDTTGWTRRKILSLIASVYDPLGLISPIMLKLKLYFQTLWTSDKSWDFKLDEDAENE